MLAFSKLCSASTFSGEAGICMHIRYFVGERSFRWRLRRVKCRGELQQNSSSTDTL